VEFHFGAAQHVAGLGIEVPIGVLRSDVLPGAGCAACSGIEQATGGGYGHVDAIDRGGAGAIVSLEVAPNPAAERAALLLELARGGELSVTLHDVSGRQVGVLFQSELPAGSHQFPIDLTAIPSGSYHVVVRVPGALLQHALTVVR